MRITPLDIQHKTFRSALRGYHEEDVDKFLDEVSTELERLFTENSELKERLDKNKDKLTEYKKMEQTLHNTLLTAQRLADEIKENAEKEASVSLQEAAAKSREVLEAAVKQREELLTSIDRLRKAEEQFRTKLRSVLDTYYELIDKSEQIIRPEFFESEESLGEQVSELLAKPEFSAAGLMPKTAEHAFEAQTLPVVEEHAPVMTAQAPSEVEAIPGESSMAPISAPSAVTDDAPTQQSIPVAPAAGIVATEMLDAEIPQEASWSSAGTGEPGLQDRLGEMAPAEGYPGRFPSKEQVAGESGDRPDRPFIGFYDQDGSTKVDFSDLGEGVPGALRRARQGRDEEVGSLAATETDAK